MATFSISGNNASYTLTLSGMSTSTRYHVFVADLNSDGSISGYICRRSSLGTASSWTYSGSSSSPYSEHIRPVMVRTTTASTSHVVGQKYTYSQVTSGTTYFDYQDIPAATPTTHTYYYRYRWMTTGGATVATSSTYSAQSSSNGISVTLSSIPTYDGWVKTGDYSAISGCSLYTSQNYAWCTSTSSSSPATIGVYVTAAAKTYYWRVRYLLDDGTLVSETASSHGDSSSGSYGVTLDDIAAPYGYEKIGTYVGLQNCSIYPSYGYASVTGTSDTSSGRSYIGVYVQQVSVTYYWKYRYINANTSAVISDSATMHGDSRAGYYAVPFSDITNLSERWEKTGTYTTIQNCSVYTSQSHVRCTGTQGNVSIIGVYLNRIPIDLFYWAGSDSADNNIIATGQPVTNLTSARWNSLLAKIKELAEAQGGSFSYTAVSSGDAITAARFNAARTAIANRSGHGTLPAAQSAGNTIRASLFNGNTSLKSALNTAIEGYNNG